MGVHSCGRDGDRPARRHDACFQGRTALLLLRWRPRRRDVRSQAARALERPARRRPAGHAFPEDLKPTRNPFRHSAGSLRQRRQHGVAHLDRANFLHSGLEYVRGAITIRQHRAHGAFDHGRPRRRARTSSAAACAADRIAAKRIGDVPAGDVRRRAVHRLVQARDCLRRSRRTAACRSNPVSIAAASDRMSPNTLPAPRSRRTASARASTAIAAASTIHVGELHVGILRLQTSMTAICAKAAIVSSTLALSTEHSLPAPCLLRRAKRRRARCARSPASE